MNGNGHLTPSTISTNTSATPSRSNSFLGTPPSPSKKKGAPIEGGLEVQMGRGAKESILRIPLQTEDWNAATARKMEPMRRTGISFRTPNIEKEHLLSITLFTTSHPNGFYVARVPIQILTGESDEVVDFDKAMEEAIAKGEDWTKIDLGGRKGGVGGALLLQGWGG
ncbi:hypothetical protein BT69DRAFT_1284934 [Atractiella rhizophila]|nr:hypothetical protein BT69DRAFT_1284934 [Atractiella rhizophila]